MSDKPKSKLPLPKDVAELKKWASMHYDDAGNPIRNPNG